MIKKLIWIIGLCCYSTVFAHTLVIDAKKYGQSPMQIVHVYVGDSGYNTLGVFIIRFINGQEISLGRQSDWEYFRPRYVDDFDHVAR